MKFIRRIVFSPQDNISFVLEELGFFFKQEESELLCVIEIDEADARWPILKLELEKSNVIESVRTEFSEAEMSSAHWLALRSGWCHGYPLPTDDFGYRMVTYKEEKYCAECGVGLVQKSAFRIKKEPKWGKRNVLQLNWVGDELFLNPRVYDRVCKPLGIRCRPVLDKDGREELKTILQIVISEIADVDTKHLKENICECCGQLRYAPLYRGPFPQLIGEPSSHIAKTNVFFGDNAASSPIILVSQSLYRKLIEVNKRGFCFEPWS